MTVDRQPRDIDLPELEDEPTFDAPWQARAFALAVALTDRNEYEWTDFQRRLVEEIEAAGETEEFREGDESIYYGQWLDALERLLIEDGILDPGDLAERASEFAAGDRDASEFVTGDPHGHADHDHHGHHHDHEH